MLLSGSSFSWPYLPSMWHTGALWRQLATTTWSTPSQPFYNGSTISSIPPSSATSSAATHGTDSSCFNSSATNSSSVIDPLLGTSGLFNSSSSSSPSATFATANPSFYANCYAALHSASTFSSTMASPNMMNGMNFFNLNSSNTSGSLFGSTGSSGTSTYKESCKYGSSTQDDEDIENEDDGERMNLTENGQQHNNNNNNKSESYERTIERGSSLVTNGEDNTD